MDGVFRFVPGLAGALCAFGVSKLLAWTDAGFDLGGSCWPTWRSGSSSIGA